MTVRWPARTALALSALSLSWYLVVGTATGWMGLCAFAVWLAWVLTERLPVKEG